MISISKNVYINKLDDIVNKYSNTCNSKIKIKSVGVKSSTYINFDKSTILNLKLVVMYKHQNIKTFLQKVTLGVGLKVKNTVPWTYFINNRNNEEIVGRFYEKELQKSKII